MNGLATTRSGIKAEMEVAAAAAAAVTSPFARLLFFRASRLFYASDYLVKKTKNKIGALTFLNPPPARHANISHPLDCPAAGGKTAEARLRGRLILALHSHHILSAAQQPMNYSAVCTCQAGRAR